MTYEEHHEALEFTYHFLDTFVDFEPFLERCETLEELRDAVWAEYYDTELVNNKYMQGNIFNVMSDHNLIKYLKKRYGDRFSAYEYTTYNISLK